MNVVSNVILYIFSACESMTCFLRAISDHSGLFNVFVQYKNWWNGARLPPFISRIRLLGVSKEWKIVQKP